MARRGGKEGRSRLRHLFHQGRGGGLGNSAGGRDFGGVGSPKGASNFTLKEALEKYKDEVSPTKAGKRWEEIRLDKLINDLEFVGERMSDIGADQIAAWRDHRLKSVATSSVRREMTLLSSVFEQARREWRWCPSNPVREVRRPKSRPPRDRRISAAEEALILEGLGYQEEWRRPGKCRSLPTLS
ncbi:hypothetical protein NMC42_11165 [Pseudomonas aeruginosa]